LAEIINCSKADRRKQLTFPNELGELPGSMRWEVQEGAILENNSVDVTVRIPSDYSDGTRDAKRLERTKRAGPSGGVGLISRIATPGGRIRDHVAFEQFLCFEMAVCADALLRP
jgi:hypothetical protein